MKIKNCKIKHNIFIDFIYIKYYSEIYNNLKKT